MNEENIRQAVFLEAARDEIQVLQDTVQNQAAALSAVGDQSRHRQLTVTTLDAKVRIARNRIAELEEEKRTLVLRNEGLEKALADAEKAAKASKRKR